MTLPILDLTAPVHWDDKALKIYPDGSMYSGPRRTGWAYILEWLDKEGELQRRTEAATTSFSNATNQEMELEAIIQALTQLTGRHSPVDLSTISRVVIFTDAQYVADNFLNAYRWKGNGWRDSAGRPLANHNQWKELLSLHQKLRGLSKPLEVLWTKGKKHGTTKAADKAAKSAANLPVRKDFRPGKVRRKLTSQSVDLGSVRPLGQLLSIRIIEERGLGRNGYQYKFEVRSKGSPFFGRVDRIYSSHILRAGRTYFVRLNSDSKFPQIVRVFRELKK